MKRLNPLILLVMITSLILAACTPVDSTGSASTDGAASDTMTDTTAMEGGDLGVVEVAEGDPIDIAYMLTVSGATAFLGEDSRGGIELAIADRGGELLGHEINLVGEDSLCSAEGGQTAAQAVAADPQIIGVIGTNCSSANTAALPIISGAGLTMISPSATSPALTDPSQTYMPGFFRTAHNDLFQGRVAAEFAYNELEARTLATIHDGSPYADGLQAVAADVFVELGGEVTFQGAVNVGETDMQSILNEIATNPPNVLYFPIFEPESNFIADQARQIAALDDTVLMSADGSFVDSFPENTGEAAVGMYMSSPYLSPDDDAYANLLSEWEATYGGSPPSGFHAHAYDATNMLLNSIEEVAVQNDDGSLSIDRQALRDAVGSIADYPGITGSLTCGETGDCATGEALAVYEITQDEVDGNWPPPVVYTP